jgi:uncharacterized membrane protein YjdF
MTLCLYLSGISEASKKVILNKITPVIKYTSLIFSTVSRNVGFFK